MEIKNWWVSRGRLITEGRVITGFCVSGHVYGHPKFEDGTFITTSPIEKINVQDVSVETATGSIYKLGKPVPEMEWEYETLFGKYREDKM